MMGHQHDGCGGRVGSEIRKAAHKSFAGAQVEAGGRLIEHKEIGATHECAGKEYLLAFTLAQCAEPALRQVAEPSDLQQIISALTLLVGVLMPPGLERRVHRRHDHVLGNQVWAKQLGERRADNTDPLSVPTPIDPLTKPRAQNLDVTMGRVQPPGHDLHECRLATAIRPQDRPPLARAHAQRQAIERPGRTTVVGQPHILKVQHHSRGHGGTTYMPIEWKHEVPIG